MYALVGIAGRKCAQLFGQCRQVRIVVISAGNVDEFVHLFFQVSLPTELPESMRSMITLQTRIRLRASFPSWEANGLLPGNSEKMCCMHACQSYARFLLEFKSKMLAQTASHCTDILRLVLLPPKYGNRLPS